MEANILGQPPQHSRRVESWVYTILNPLIEALRREGELLKKGNLTWRWYSRKCEYLRPIVEYVEDSHWPIYEDFLADDLNSNRKGDIDRHDASVAQLEAAASRFFDGLMQSDLFNEQVSKTLTEYESRVAAAFKPLPPDAMKADLSKYIAECLINRTEILPPHYLAHQFWSAFGREFERSEDEFAGYEQRGTFRSLNTSSGALQEISGRLLAELEKHRIFLCRAYDIPAAPVISK